MTVLFFKVENVLNNETTQAIAPSGKPGVASECLRTLRQTLNEMPAGTQLVLYGDWTNDWSFSKCSEDGQYLNRKLERKGLHIMDKTDSVQDYVERKHIEAYRVME